jgi:hypothetical protein
MDTPRSHQSKNPKGREKWKQKVGAIAKAHANALREFFFIDDRVLRVRRKGSFRSLDPTGSNISPLLLAYGVILGRSTERKPAFSAVCVESLSGYAAECSASPRLAQRALPALAGLGFVAEDIAPHDDSFSNRRRNFGHRRRRRWRSSFDHLGFRLVEPSREARKSRLLGPLLRRFALRRAVDFAGRCRSARRRENRLGRLECRAVARTFRRGRFSCRRSRLSPKLRRLGGLLQPRRPPSRARSVRGLVFRPRVLAKRTGRRIVDDEARKDPSLGSGGSRIGKRLLRLPHLEYRVRGALRVPIERRPNWRGLEQSPVRG